MEHQISGNDPVLRRLIAEAEADPETIGLILSGSRGAGHIGPESDYDVEWVLTDAAFGPRKERDESTLSLAKFGIEGVKGDLWYGSPATLARHLSNPSWETFEYSCARVLLDKTGEVTAALEAFRWMPEEKAKADAAGWFDAYLNAFYRSMKAWRRGDELGARLHAAASAGCMLQTLFALERRWMPYFDRLHQQLDHLSGQGWPPGFLQETLLDLVDTGDPTRQQALEARVEALLRERGYGHVVDAWDGQIERVRAFRFE